MEKIRLDVGCGERIREGFMGIDKRKIPGVHKVIDLSKKKLPYKNESVDEIYSSHFLEHVPNVESVFLDLIRVLKVGGTMTISVPFYSSPIAFDPDHKAFFNPYSFSFFVEGCSTFKHAPTYLKYIEKPKMKFNYFKDWKDNFFKPFEFFANHFTKLYIFSFAFIIPAFEIEYKFTKSRKFDWKEF